MLRPFSLGELLDRSVSFWREHWRPLFQLMLGFQVVALGLMDLAQVLGRAWFPLASDPIAVQRTPSAALPHLLGVIALFGVVTLAALWLAQISSVGVTRFVWERVTRRGAPSPGDAFRHTATLLGTTSGTFAVSMAWSALVLALSLVPGVGLGSAAAWALSQDNSPLAWALAIGAALLLVAALVGVSLWFVIRFLLLSQVVAVESPSVWHAMRRAGALSSGRVGPGFGGVVKVRLTVLITIIGLLLMLLTAVSSAPTLIAGAIFGANFTPGQTSYDVTPLWVLAPLQLLQVLLSALVGPLFAVFQTFFYADMRARREGLDLELALAELAP